MQEWAVENRRFLVLNGHLFFPVGYVRELAKGRSHEHNARVAGWETVRRTRGQPCWPRPVGG